MSGPGAKGAKQRARVFQDGKASYQGGNIQRTGLVDVDKKLQRQSLQVLIGLRVRNDQDILSLRIFGKKGTVEIPVAREAAGGTIATQLNIVAPAAGEKWIGFVSNYDVNLHGKNGFKTDIKVSNFTADPNGFQEVPNADPEPKPDDPPETTTKKPKATKKAAKKAAKKAPKKAKARRKTKARRKKR